MKVERLGFMGTDLDVVNAAKVSYSNQSTWDRVDYKTDRFVMDQGDGSPQYLDLSDKDKKLINYLATHKHWTPFAHTAIKLRVGAPVPIRTQCFKHKVGMVENEESRRYISSTPEIYLPTEWRMAPKKGQSKQGSHGVHKRSKEITNEVNEFNSQALRLYSRLIQEGVCPEQARFVLPQGTIVNWIWTGNLVSFANFYNKRTDVDAQKEVRDLALQVGEVISPLFPVSWEALTK